MDLSIKNMDKYLNYLSMNNHKPLHRAQYKDKFNQMDYYKKQEGDDMAKLELGIQYLKKLNYLKYKELNEIERSIKDRLDKKLNQPSEQIKMHL